MFRQERNTSPFSLLDMDMWDTNLTSQSSAWYGAATVSGSGFLSKVNASSTGGPGSFRQTDRGLRKWQSLSHLSPNASPRSYSPSPPPSHLRLGRSHSGLRQTGVMQWLQEAQDRMDSQIDLLTADSRLDSGNLLDIKSRERQTADTELYKLKQALREAETRAKRQEEECKQTQQKLQTATEAHGTLLNQSTELNQRLAQTLQNHLELKDQLTEANNKISQACLDKAMLSTQVLNLEDNVRELKTQLSAALHDKDYLAQERADLQEKAYLLEEHLEKNVKSQESCELHNGLDSAKTDHQETASLKEEVTALRQVNEDLTNEIQSMEQLLKTSLAQVQELATENNMKSHQIKDLEAELYQLVKDKQELQSKMMASEQEDVKELKEELNTLRSLKFENRRHRDRCVFLDTEVFEKDHQLKLLEEKYKRIDAGRVQHIEELKAVVSHWTEKWETVALSLQSTQEELEELKKKKNNETGQNETGQNETGQNESMLRLELDACKQELELQRHRTQAAPKKGCETVQTQDKETLTDFCLQLPALTPDGHVKSHNNQDKQLVQNDFGNDWEVEDQTDAQVIESLKVQLEDSKRTANQLQEEKTLILQKLHTVNQLYLAKDERPPAKDRTNTIDIELQRRMVTEQLKSIFKEREENKVNFEQGSVPAQDWTQMSRGVRNTLDRRSWHQGSGLMPVFEEEEPGEEDQDATVKMSSVREKNRNHKNSEAQDPVMLRSKPRIKALAEEVSQTCAEVSELQKTLFCPDGVFHVEVVDICSSPDEDEEGHT